MYTHYLKAYNCSTDTMKLFKNRHCRAISLQRQNFRIIQERITVLQQRTSIPEKYITFSHHLRVKFSSTIKASQEFTFSHHLRANIHTYASARRILDRHHPRAILASFKSNYISAHHPRAISQFTTAHTIASFKSDQLSVGLLTQASSKSLPRFI